MVQPKVAEVLQELLSESGKRPQGIVNNIHRYVRQQEIQLYIVCKCVRSTTSKVFYFLQL